MVEEREVATQTLSPDHITQTPGPDHTTQTPSPDHTTETHGPEHTSPTGKQRESDNNLNGDKAQYPASEPEVLNQSKQSKDEEHPIDIQIQDEEDEEGGERVDEAAAGLEQVPGPTEERRRRVSVRKRTVSLEKASSSRETRTVWRREEEEMVLENTNPGLDNTEAVTNIQHSELSNTPHRNNVRIKISTR